jgi:hypothetical protein
MGVVVTCRMVLTVGVGRSLRTGWHPGVLSRGMINCCVAAYFRNVQLWPNFADAVAGAIRGDALHVLLGWRGVRGTGSR